MGEERNTEGVGDIAEHELLLGTPCSRAWLLLGRDPSAFPEAVSGYTAHPYREMWQNVPTPAHPGTPTTALGPREGVPMAHG